MEGVAMSHPLWRSSVVAFVLNTELKVNVGVCKNDNDLIILIICKQNKVQANLYLAL